MASSSSTPSTITLPKKYQVFLSFRGADTRVGFTSHLYDALSGKCMVTFIDYKLARGDEISTALLKSIEESMIAVVIFSKDYASSTWCLRELAEIMKREKLRELTVIPVFYNVVPSDVRYQTGPFKDSFAKHENDSPEEVLEWREAFTEASHRAGCESAKTRSDAELVHDIVEGVQNKLMGEIENISPPLYDLGLIGIENRITPVLSLLRLGRMDDVQIIGIWGMGGIGKTTLTEVVFNQISGLFDGSCFVAKVGERLENGETNGLQLEVLSKVLHEENLQLATPTILNPFIQQRLSQRKVLIVFDDVNNFLRLDGFVKGLQFGLGSRIIITSRDKQVLHNFKVPDSNIYKVKGLDFAEALKLFSNHAFNQNHPIEDFKALSKRMVRYANGNPLALKVLGSALLGMSKQEWESAVDDLQGIGDSDIFNVLKISYDRLNDKEKNLFLDIACFFNVGKNEDYIAELLDCKYSLRVLVNKSLITIDEGEIEMHDLLQEMGSEIVRRESPKNPGKCSRLWKPVDVIRTLKNNNGTKAVEGIHLYMDSLEDVHLSLSCRVFDKMPNLRLLLFVCDFLLYNVHLPNGLNSLPDELIILEWPTYPLRALPSNFSPEKLVKLNLSYSNIEQLWEGTKHAPKLKRLILSNCRYLITIPNLSDSLLLEEVVLLNCESLVDFPSSIQQLKKLRYLYLYGCSNVTKFPLTSASIERLGLSRTAIEEVPSSIQSLTNLESLDCSECRGLTILPALSGLRSLSRLSLKKCNLMEIPEDIGCLSSLEWLDLSGNLFESLPKSIKHLSKLQSLILRDCNMLRSLTELPVALHELDATNCKQLCQALSDASEFKRCITSEYHECDQHGKKLCQLCPPRYKYVNFSFTNCFNLDQKAVGNVFEESLKGSEEPPTRFSIYLPGTEIPEWFTYQSLGSSINIQVLRQDLVNRKFMGFAICAVLGIEEENHIFGYKFHGVQVHFETRDAYIGFPTCRKSAYDPISINSNHILLGYSSFSKVLSSSQNLEMLIANDNDYVDISFEFKFNVKVKYCAVHPTYAEPIEIIGATIEDIGVASLKRSGRSNDNEEEVEPHPKRIAPNQIDSPNQQ